MNATAVNKAEQFRARLTDLRAKQDRIPYELADAEAGLGAARERARMARQHVIRVRAQAEIGEASASELKAVEHTSRLAAETEREAEDRLGTVMEKLPALAAALADTTEAYRSERAPVLIADGEGVADRIEKALTELLAAFEEGEAIATEMTTDFVTVTNGHGFSAIDRRIPASLPGVLAFGKQITKLAERWRTLRGKN